MDGTCQQTVVLSFLFNLVNCDTYLSTTVLALCLQAVVHIAGCSMIRVSRPSVLFLILLSSTISVISWVTRVFLFAKRESSEVRYWPREDYMVKWINTNGWVTHWDDNLWKDERKTVKRQDYRWCCMIWQKAEIEKDAREQLKIRMLGGNCQKTSDDNDEFGKYM